MQEVQSLTEECKNATTNKADCYSKLEVKINEATNLDVSASSLSDSVAVLREYQKSVADAQVY